MPGLTKNVQVDRTGAVILLALSLAVVALFVAASPGFFIIDEVIYFMGVDALASAGRLTVENGAPGLASRDLNIWLLRSGPSGLAPQYPFGSAFAAAPLTAVFGDKALIALNALAGLGTLFATRALAWRLFRSDHVANLSVVLLVLGTFWSEYVIGHWPHSVTIFTTTTALWLFLVALDRERRAWLPAALSGFAVGVGLVFRLESVLVLPGIAAATILYAKQPVRILFAGALGIAPMLAVLAVTNEVKFGTWNPLSYGGSGGATDLTRHMMAGMAMLAALGLLPLLRWAGTRAVDRRWGLLAAFAAVIVVFTVPPLNAVAARVVTGAHALLLDATTIVDPRGMVRPSQDGTQLFWGLPKKALVQSLPWLGAFALLAGFAWGEFRRSIVIVLAVFAGWALPFLLLSWHGGLGSNMRYFLPTLPALCAVVGWLVLGLVHRAGGWRPLLLGGFVAAVAGVAWLFLLPGRSAQLHQIVSTYAFIGVAGLCLAAGILARPVLDRGALAAIGAGLGLAMVLAGSDVTTSQFVRSEMAVRSAAAAEIPGQVVFYGAPKAFAGSVGNPDHLMALPSLRERRADAAFISDACAAGFRVVMPQGFEANSGFERWQVASERDAGLPEGLVELQCSETSDPEARAALTSRSD